MKKLLLVGLVMMLAGFGRPAFASTNLFEFKEGQVYRNGDGQELIVTKVTDSPRNVHFSGRHVSHNDVPPEMFMGDSELTKYLKEHRFELVVEEASSNGRLYFAYWTNGLPVYTNVGICRTNMIFKSMVAPSPVMDESDFDRAKQPEAVTNGVTATYVTNSISGDGMTERWELAANGHHYKHIACTNATHWSSSPSTIIAITNNWQYAGWSDYVFDARVGCLFYHDPQCYGESHLPRK